LSDQDKLQKFELVDKVALLSIKGVPIAEKLLPIDLGRRFLGKKIGGQNFF
jgi:hypothetical protein